MTGIVYKSTGSWYWVKTSNNAVYKCKIKGKFRIKGIKSTNPIAVGDQVEIQLETLGDEEIGVIKKIMDRENYIVRKSVNLSKQTHIIAANVDLVFLLVTINNPTTFPVFIDRFLVSTRAYRIETVLLFNKIDLYNLEELMEMRSLKEVYEKIGYDCHEVVATDGDTLDAIQKIMAQKVSMFSGHSGVGKSTLLNTLSPGLDLKTANVSAQHEQGQHTTTFAEMFDLEGGAKIIDTPGIKGFGVVDIEKEELSGYFIEFSVLKEQCKFNNCMHINEPQCAVKSALEKGEIAQSRYKSYLQLLEDDVLYR